MDKTDNDDALSPSPPCPSCGSAEITLFRSDSGETVLNCRRCGRWFGRGNPLDKPPGIAGLKVKRRR